MATRSMDLRVVGVTFCDDYPGNLHRLREIVEQRYESNGEGRWAAVEEWSQGDLLGEPIPVRLIRNPENEHDENAVEVHVPILGRHGTMIGHVPRELAARLAPRMDEGIAFSVAIKAVYVDPAHEDRPGIEIRVSREMAESAA
jgi:hypothetical protein